MLARGVRLGIVLYLCLALWLIAGTVQAEDRIPAERTLVVARAVRAPDADDPADPIWQSAKPVSVRLNMDGTAPLGAPALAEVALRSIVANDTLYFHARWDDPQPLPADPNAIENKLTMLWALETGSDRGVVQNGGCATLCHIAYVQPQASLVKMQVVTIPQTDAKVASASGGWSQGAWTIVWSRPLVTAAARDMQFGDPDRAYRFGVALVLGEGKVAHSGDHHHYQLRFQSSGITGLPATGDTTLQILTASAGLLLLLCGILLRILPVVYSRRR